jgi:hypothetical protein
MAHRRRIMTEICMTRIDEGRVAKINCWKGRPVILKGLYREMDLAFDGI